MQNDGELEVDTLEVARAQLFDLDRAPGIPYSLEPEPPADEELILDADDVAAELMPDVPSAPPPRRSGLGLGLQPSAAGSLAAYSRAVFPPRARRHTPAEPFLPLPAVDPFAQLSAADPFAQQPTSPSSAPLASALQADELRAAHAEIARLQKQMRARDAYLAEIERALDASTRQLEAAGLGSIEDAQRLLGRVRGQAFRIAELESELRQLHQPQVQESKHKPAAQEATRRAKARASRPRVNGSSSS